MTVDDLTPVEREEVQVSYLRSWWGRRRRRLYAAVRLAEPRKTYDLSGRLIAIKGQSITPRVTTFAEDRAR